MRGKLLCAMALTLVLLSVYSSSSEAQRRFRIFRCRDRQPVCPQPTPCPCQTTQSNEEGSQEPQGGMKCSWTFICRIDDEIVGIHDVEGCGDDRDEALEDAENCLATMCPMGSTVTVLPETEVCESDPMICPNCEEAQRSKSADPCCQPTSYTCMLTVCFGNGQVVTISKTERYPYQACRKAYERARFLGDLFGGVCCYKSRTIVRNCDE